MLSPRFLALALCLLLPFALFAQPKKSVIGDEQNQNSAVKTEVTLLDRVTNVPSVYLQGDTVRDNTPLEVKPQLLNLKYNAPTIKPTPLQRQTLAKTVYPFWAKAGFGVPTQPYAEVAYDNVFARKFALGLHGKYHSADNSNTLQYQAFQNWGLDGTARYYLDTAAAVGVHIGYDVRNLNFYGYDHTAASMMNLTAADVKQRFNTLNGGVELFSAARNDADLSYSLNADLYNYTDNAKSAETGITAKGELTKWFGDKHPLTVRVTEESYAYTLDTIKAAKQNRNVLTVAPSFTWHGGAFRIKAGANLAFTSEGFKPFPDVEVLVNIADNAFTAYAGWSGSAQAQTFRSLTTYNPFIQTIPGAGMKTTLVEERYLGFKGTVGEFNYDLRGAWMPTQNLATFNSLNTIYGVNTTDTRRFVVLYDTANMINFRAALGATPIEHLRLDLTGEYHIYNTKNLTQAWGLPHLSAKLGARYDLSDAFEIRADLYALGGIHNSTLEGTSAPFTAVDKTLPTIVDVNLGARYRVLKNLTIFLDLNNVTNQQAQRWANYPNFGFNLLGGVTLRLR